MVVVSYSGKEINAKLVYYGPGLSGKTTNLEFIYDSVPNTHRGKMVSMKTRTERTLFFDFLPVDLGEMGGFKTRFLLYTVPGQVYYNATRKLVLRGVDAVVFVADSGRGKMNENLESLENLKENLREYGMDLEKMPWVLQYNKRDLPDVYTIEEMDQALNPTKVPTYEAVATNGSGVFETFKGISKLLLEKLSKEVKTGPRMAQTASAVLDAKKAAESPALQADAPAAAGAAPAMKVVPPVPPAATPAAAAPDEPALPKQAPSKPAPPRQAPPVAPPVAAEPKREQAPVVHGASMSQPEPVRMERPVEEKVTLGKRIARLFGMSKPEPVFEEPAEEMQRGRRTSDEGRPVAAPAAPKVPATLARVEIAGTISHLPVLERRVRVPVPVRMTSEELQQGVTLKLILEVELSAETDEVERTGT